jgi:hypothetical protein
MCLAHLFVSVGLLAAGAVWAADAGLGSGAGGRDAAPPAPAGIELTGQVREETGRPVGDMVVFAVDRTSPQIRAVARSGRDGKFRMLLAPEVHDFGIMSIDWLLTRFDRPGPNAVVLTVAPSFPEIDPVAAVQKTKQSFVTLVFPYGREGQAAAVVPGGKASIGILTGTVRDEQGAGLGGVRILANDERRGVLRAVTQSDRNGRYTLVTVAGPNRLIVYAPGLLLGKVRRQDKAGVFDLVLKADPTPQDLRLRTGRVLSFRLDDSLMPEAMPPRQARSAISVDYGIDLSFVPSRASERKHCFCPGDLINAVPPTLEQRRDACLWNAGASCSVPSRCPLTTWAYQCRLPRYWWLRMLQQYPPNPTQRTYDGGGEATATMWWYDMIRTMQQEDARAAAQAGAGK